MNLQNDFTQKREHLTLYTTASCPSCRVVKPLLEQAGLDFETRDANEHFEEATALGIRQVPALAVQGSEKTTLLIGVDQIKGYIKEQNR